MNSHPGLTTRHFLLSFLLWRGAFPSGAELPILLWFAKLGVPLPFRLVTVLITRLCALGSLCLPEYVGLIGSTARKTLIGVYRRRPP